MKWLDPIECQNGKTGNLLITSAALKELLRCMLIEANWFKQSLTEYRVSYSSTGYPRSVAEDDEYMGYKISRILPL